MTEHHDWTSRIRDSIHDEAQTVRRLRDTLGSTYLFRYFRPKAWSKAAERVQTHKSSLRHFLDPILAEPVITEPRFQEFAIAYLEEDQYYFGSGYVKESLLRRLKRSPLDEDQIRRLRAVVLDAIEQRPYREYKHYCRLAVAIQDDALVRTIESLVDTASGAKRSRARLMLQVVRDSGR